MSTALSRARLPFFGLALALSCSSDPQGPAVPQPAGGSGSAGQGSGAAAGAAVAGSSGSAGASFAGAGGNAGAIASGGTAGESYAGSSGSSGSAGIGGGPYEVPTNTWPSAECVAQVETLVGQMTKAQKAAQMVMGQDPSATPSSVSNLSLGNVFSGGSFEPPGGPSPSNWANYVDPFVSAGNGSSPAIPILFGIDAIHGHNKATSAVIFPHNIGLGAGNNPALVEQIGQITALEVAATGMTWTFAPMLSVAYDDRWGRVYESYSEDPAITALLGAAAVLGLQGRGGLGTGAPGIVACAKHFAGDGQATYGTGQKDGNLIDRGNVQIDEDEMRALGIVPYQQALKAGLGSVMVSDASWNGDNMTGHQHLLQDILKGELAFQGFVATDWQAAGSAGGFVAAANAGVDMFMEPVNWPSARDQIAAGVSDDRVNDAARRILTVKCEAGLFGWTRDNALMAEVGSDAHRQVARQAVKESLVLLQNNNSALPLAKNSNVWVGGSGADSLTNQMGGWTIEWQGNGSRTTGTTVVDAIGKVATVVGSMDQADTAVVVLAENPSSAYAEFFGDKNTIDTINTADFALLAQAKGAGKKVVAIILSGRPVLITDELADADAWIAAWLPGSEGDGIADVLFGDYAPTGKLSHSWPASGDQANQNMGDPGFIPLFPFGHGLAYP